MELEDYKDEDLLNSIEAELAKATNEWRCAQGDLEKINSRLRFCLLALHIIKQRKVNR